MNHRKLLPFCVVTGLLVGSAAPGRSEPLLSSWFTANSGKYARIYTSAANRAAGISNTTWTGQTLPTYAGVHEIDYSGSWVYIRNSGLGGHVMGPWNNPNLPKNQGTSTSTHRFPRTPTIPGNKTATGMGAIGIFVDGVAIYNTSDGFSYSNPNGKDATPTGGIGSGNGIWNRDAWPNEFTSFDAAYAHNPPSGQYHSHANPLATRYLLGDYVTYDSTNKTYAENLAPTTFQHSPIIGWLNDGIPLYGPYGYDGGSTGAAGVATVAGGAVTAVNVTSGGASYQSVPAVTFSGGGGLGATGNAVVSGGVVTAVVIVNGGSGYSSPPTVTIGGVRRMVSGYVKRDGSYGTANLTTTGRTTLPAWAAAQQNRNATLSSGQFGPATTLTTGSGPTLISYTLGHYAEDYDYLGDLGYTQGSRTNPGGVLFDLNKYNARFCVTPEYPGGTWAYFLTLQADGTPAFPYLVGPWFLGTPIGGASTTSVMNADTPLTQYFKGGASLAETWTSAPVGVGGGNVTITWNAVEGGTYQVSASSQLTDWTPLAGSVTATGTTASAVDPGVVALTPRRFYKITRTSLATYDSNGY